MFHNDKPQNSLLLSRHLSSRARLFLLVACVGWVVVIVGALVTVLPQNGRLATPNHQTPAIFYHDALSKMYAQPWLSNVVTESAFVVPDVNTLPLPLEQSWLKRNDLATEYAQPWLYKESNVSPLAIDPIDGTDYIIPPSETLQNDQADIVSYNDRYWDSTKVTAYKNLLSVQYFSSKGFTRFPYVKPVR